MADLASSRKRLRFVGNFVRVRSMRCCVFVVVDDALFCGVPPDLELGDAC